ncbi:MAG: hypothetical protein AAF823_11870 [Planctomycetota bacterium]
MTRETRPILDLHHAAGDANLGQTLLRLARLAAAADRTNPPSLVPAAHGRAAGQRFPAAALGGSVRTESDR